MFNSISFYINGLYFMLCIILISAIIMFIFEIRYALGKEKSQAFEFIKFKQIKQRNERDLIEILTDKIKNRK